MIIKAKIIPFESGSAQVELYDAAPDPDTLIVTITGFLDVEKAEDYALAAMSLNYATDEAKDGLLKAIELLGA